jgi:nucleotide-binding universal stress UspA family protein
MRIGVAYDESPESEAALALARTLTAPINPALQVLQVVPVATYNYFGAVPLGASVEELLTDANSRLKGLTEVEARAVYGIAGEELAAFSGRLDLLVAGSRGYGPLRHLMLGSTTTYLERHARCSLLVLPRTATNTK